MMRPNGAWRLGLGALLVSFAASPAWGVLTHQYTFNDGTANDSVGTAHGTLVNGAGVAAGSLQLSNPDFAGAGTSVTGRYLSLPVSILPTSGSVTIEQWFTFRPSGFFSEAWTFTNSNNDTAPPGANVGQYLMHVISSPQPANPPGGGGTGGSRISQALSGFAGSLTPPPGPETFAYETTPGLGAGGGGYLDNNQTFMAATVIDASAGPTGTLSYYVFRQSDGAGGLQQAVPAIPLSSYQFTNAYLGRSAFTNDTVTSGTVDEFRIYNEARTAAQILSDFTTGSVAGGPRLTVDRTTGAITLTNAGTALKIFNYTINSASGTLNTANIQPISKRLDAASNGGNGSFDNNDAWTVQTNTAMSLSELEAVGEGADDGGTLGTVTLSAANGWVKSFRQDITASIQVFDGVNFVTSSVPVTYTGNNNLAFKRSDLNFDNAINGSDWNIFKANHLVAVNQTLTIAQTYPLGDLNGDKAVGGADFRLFKTDFIAANGLATWDALGAAIPEPGSLLLAVVACALGRSVRRRR